MLTPEQERLREAAKAADSSPAAWPFYARAYEKLATPAAILDLLALVEKLQGEVNP